MRMPYWRSLSSVLAIGALIAAGAWAAGLGTGPGVTYAAAVRAATGYRAMEDANGTQTTPIRLPARLGQFEDLVAVTRQHSASAAAFQARMQGHTASLTIAAYERAYSGASVAYRAYADNTLELLPSVIAVRAPSPGLTLGPVMDPADLGLAIDDHTVQLFGDVSCAVYNGAVVAGQKVNPASLTYEQCQRTGPHLSVFVYGGGFEGNTGRDAIVALTNAAYNAVTGN